MIAAEQRSWQEANKDYLVRALKGVRAALVAANGKGGEGTADGEEATLAPGDLDRTLAAIAAEMHAPPTLKTLCDLFSLTAFERDVLLLCAGMELDSRLAREVPAGGPTFSLALSALAGPHWSALAPTAPLRRWRLLDAGAGDSLTTARLKIDERVLHYLVGVECLDERLFGLLEPLPQRAAMSLPPSQQAVVEDLLGWWQQPAAQGWPLVELVGADGAAQVAIVAETCARLGLSVGRCRGLDVPAAAADRDALMLLLQREAALAGMVILLDARGVEAGSTQGAAVEALLEGLGCRVVVTSGASVLNVERPSRRRQVELPARREQSGLWHQSLGEAAPELAGDIERVVAQYRLDTRTITESAAEVVADRAAGREASLWDACRLGSRGRLDALAERITPRATWANLVLPETQLDVLRSAAVHLRQRTRVYDDWGFAAASDRGLGISALFAGPSGTGKTMAAEVLANELALDLYKIDLSQVVSKYIGETEKNLRRVFDAAESAGAVLLFDEADALFGKRSEVRDSHDRYANIEVSYLLQRMEAYRGVSVLTTNLKDAIDKAFLRRIRFIVQFPFPDAELRQRIWQGIFPPATPTDGLELERLAQLNVAGGGIRNIALGAAFCAAERDGAVAPEDVLRAARQEYAKADKAISDRERRGWA